MAVLYQAKGSAANADARFFELTDPKRPASSSHKSSTFFHKHIRIVDVLPSDAEMERIVQQIWDDRKKSPATKVTNALGEERRKDEIYGKIKPPANTTLFVTPGGFESLNAYIDEHCTSSNEYWVPIPGSGKVVTRSKSDVTGLLMTQIIDAGWWKISVEVGATVSIGKDKSFGSKVVYHFGQVRRGASTI